MQSETRPRKPVASFWYKNDSLFVRFEFITRSEFNSILQKFKQRFPESEWMASEKAWKLPSTQTQNLALFTHEIFGDTSLCLRTNQLQQMTLPLIWGEQSKSRKCIRRKK